jgi:UDP-N-acetylglucosamine--N-acetylmuramyl-(pentapeptide) pyrophosphoryl-undecaprenol N-acetylglucosamine transferase
MRFVIAGGGTGGHLFPGIAIAEAFIENEMGNEVLFIGTERGIESKVLTGGKFPLRTIRAMPLKGRSFLEKVKALRSIPMAVAEAYSILKSFQPQLVLGVGGYASGPTLLAASLLGIKRAIHEQNVIPGMTNRILKWFSQRIFVSFEETKKYFPEKKTIVTGNPIRRDILQPGAEVKGIEKRKGDRFALLIFGGSAGAHRINQAMMEALDHLQEMKSFLKFFHQTGREDVDWVSKGYQEKGFDAVVMPFIKDMATYYQVTDLVVCRSGASTVSELAICGKAAILIPYPHAAHNHQVINAQKLVDLGATRMIRDEELNGSLLAQTIHHLYDHPEERARMEEQIRLVGRPKAAEEIVEHCYALVRG